MTHVSDSFFAQMEDWEARRQAGALDPEVALFVEIMGRVPPSILATAQELADRGINPPLVMSCLAYSLGTSLALAVADTDAPTELLPELLQKLVPAFLAGISNSENVGEMGWLQ